MSACRCVTGSACTSRSIRPRLLSGPAGCCSWRLASRPPGRYGQDRLQVFENGIGAINLPYLHSQYGSQAARAMHPKTLAHGPGPGCRGQRPALPH